MKVVSQKIRTIHASVSVKYSEVSWLLPVCGMLGLREVENDGHSILIVLPDWSLVGGS